MATLTAVAVYVGSRIAGPGGAVLGAVAGVGVSALGEAARRWFDSMDSRRQLSENVFLPTADDDIAGSESSPAAMLVAERAIVPFLGREQGLTDLTNWCLSRNADPLRLLVGAGGTGKTRLVRELANRLNGWSCVWVRAGQEGDAIAAARRRKCLIVLDYAETRARADLARLVWHLAWPPGRHGVRVLLIARTVGDWWEELAEKTETLRARSMVENLKRTELNALTYDDNLIERHYQTAIHAFSEELGISPTLTECPVFDQGATILVIQIAALVALLGSSGSPPADQLLSRLLGHEDRYWQLTAESCGLSWLSRSARRQSVAELCLSGAATMADVAEQLKRVPDLADTPTASRRAVARWLQGLYPGEGADRLSSLRPHVLAEHLTVRELVADPEFAMGALHDLPEDIARHALTVLGYAAQHDQRAGPLILHAVEADPKRMILPAISAAVETSVSLDAWLAGQLQVASMDLLQLAELYAAIPLESQSLDRAAKVVKRRLIKEATDELNRISKTAADRAESQRQHTELMEFARVHRSLQEQGHSLPVPVRHHLLTALEDKEKDLTLFGSLSEAGNISREIAWIKSHKPKPYSTA